MADPKLIIKIVGDSGRFSKELKQVGKETDAANRRFKAAAKAGAVAFTALAVGAGAAVKAFADFEAQFTSVVTLLDKTSFKTKSLKDGIKDLKDGVLDLRRESGESFQNLNQGLFDLISAGVDAEEAIDSLRIATNLAKAGATSTSVAVDGITSALNAYSLEASEAQSISEKFFTAQKFGKTTVEELSSGFGLVASTANSFGVSLDELLASVSAVTTGGIKTSQAYTGLAAIFANITRPTAEAKEEAKRLGIEFDTTALRAKGLEGFLDSVTEAAGFNETSLEQLFGSVEAVKTILALTGAGADDFKNILSELSDETQSAATFSDALNTVNQTAAQRMKEVKGEFEAAAVEIGEEFLPVLEESTDLLKDLAPTIRDLVVPAIKALIKTIGFLATGLQEVLDVYRAMRGELNNQPDTRQYIEYAFNGEAPPELQVNEFDRDYTNIEDDGIMGRLEKQRQALFDHWGIIDEKEQERKDKKAEAKEEDGIGTEDIFGLPDEEFEDEFDKFQDRLGDIQDSKQEFADKDLETALFVLDNKKKFSKEEIDLAENVLKEKERFKAIEVVSELQKLSEIVSGNSAATKALFLLTKAAAFAETIVNTNKAYVAALAHPPGPPTTIPVAELVRAQGYVAAASIAASAIQGISAQDGGVVPGGFGGGDRVPALLEPGEIVVPERFNPLSPNFEESFGGIGGMGNNVSVQIDITDRASQFITVNQREDTKLGIQK